MEFIIFMLVSLVVFLLVKISNQNQALDSRVNEQAQRQFQQWKMTELRQAVVRETEITTAAVRESAKNEIRLAKEQARMDLEKWKTNETVKIRQDTAKRSTATHIGKVTEHVVPWFLEGMFDPRDIRFIGSPIDMVVFDGLSGGFVDAIHFIEVKSGKHPKLNEREELVKGAIVGGRVSYNILHMTASEHDSSPAINWLVRNHPYSSHRTMKKEFDEWIEQRNEAIISLEFEQFCEIDKWYQEKFFNHILSLNDQINILRNEIEKIKSQD